MFCNPLSGMVLCRQLFGEFEAHASAIGALGELVHSIHSSLVGDLAHILQHSGHLLSIEHEAHTILCLDDIALNGLSASLERDFTSFFVVGVSASERNATHFSGESVVRTKVEGGVALVDTHVLIGGSKRRNQIGGSSCATCIVVSLL